MEALGEASDFPCLEGSGMIASSPTAERVHAKVVDRLPPPELALAFTGFRLGFKDPCSRLKGLAGLGVWSFAMWADEWQLPQPCIQP